MPLRLYKASGWKTLEESAFFPELWNYSGLVDSSRISGDLMEKQEVNKRVRSLTKLTKDHAVADLAADYFDSVHPLPKVRICLLCILVVEFIGFQLCLSLYRLLF
jgi:hypothetical protein